MRCPPRWFALYVRSRFEKKIDADLRQRGVESFLPLVEEVHVWSDRKRKVLEPLFRGYLFVHTDLKNKYEIQQTDGVVRFVSVKDRPSPISDAQINWVRILSKAPGAIRREEFMGVGEMVRIIMGPFKGVEGCIVTVKDSYRVVVSLASIAQAVSVEVAPEFIERIEGSHAVVGRSF